MSGLLLDQEAPSHSAGISNGKVREGAELSMRNPQASRQENFGKISLKRRQGNQFWESMIPCAPGTCLEVRHAHQNS